MRRIISVFKFQFFLIENIFSQFFDKLFNKFELMEYLIHYVEESYFMLITNLILNNEK